jgi:predicted DNA-binding transcriptional regulator YafY
VDRIYDPILIDKEFIENRDTDLKNLYNDKIGINTIGKIGPEQAEEITLWVSNDMANYIKSMPLHKSQTYKEYRKIGEIIVTLKLVPTYELVSLILSYGKNMEIISPLWLRTEVVKELERSVSKYKKERF